MVTPAKIGSINHTVGDIHAAAEFYGAALGMPVKFTDGDRYAALDGITSTLALVSAEENLDHPAPAAAFKVGDVAAALADVVRAGGTVLRPAEQGPHEIRAMAADPWGNGFILYSGI